MVNLLEDYDDPFEIFVCYYKSTMDLYSDTPCKDWNNEEFGISVYSHFLAKYKHSQSYRQRFKAEHYQMYSLLKHPQMIDFLENKHNMKDFRKIFTW